VQVGATPDGQGEEGQWDSAGSWTDSLLRRGVRGRHTDIQGHDIRSLCNLLSEHLSSESRRLVVDVVDAWPVINLHQRDPRTEPHRGGAPLQLHPDLLYWYEGKHAAHWFLMSEPQCLGQPR